ncbi:MAG: T9SS type A sorting domain-containing protein [Paludibacter sp.]|nr:T9SS type A sorting domain-containing protein [Paludibacter sp.]
MKKKFIFTLLVLMFGLFSPNLFAVRSYKMELKNIVQINENELRFDVYLTNTSSTPAADFIAISGIQLQVTFNNLMLNGGRLNGIGSLSYVTGTSDLDPVSTKIFPTGGAVSVNNQANPALQTTIQFVAGGTIQPGEYMPYIADNKPVRIGTFKARVMSTPPKLTNYASVLPNLQLHASGCILLWTYVDFNLFGDLKYTRSSDPVDYVITNQTLVSPSLSDRSLGANRGLYSSAYTGTGNYSAAANWNTSLDPTDPSYHVVPTNTTANISIGKLSTASIPVAVLGACSVDASKTVNDLTINAGSQLTLNVGSTVTATNVDLFSNAANGTGTFVDMNSSGGLTVSGASSVQQYLPMGRNWYISSPVASAPTSIVTGTTSNKLWNYTEANNGTTLLWNTISGTGNFGVTTGYIAYMAASGNLIFNGALNTGAITTPTLTRTIGALSSGYNLVGNPFPSFLNWISAVASTNTGTTNMEPTMWYRTKNPNSTYVFDTFIANGSGGGVGTSNFSGGTTAVTCFIPPMQAFWVRIVPGQSTGTLAFDNSMRSHQDQILTTNRLRSPGVVNISQPLLRLQVSNGVNSDEAIVYFNANASDGFDRFDAEKMSNNNDEIPEIYTLAGDEKVVINGLKSVYPEEELLLGFNTRKENTFSIKLTEISNFDEYTKIILKDKLLNTEQELSSDNSYSFTSGVIDNANRFSLVFKSNSITTGLNYHKVGSESIFIYKNHNGQITVSRNDAIGEGTVDVCNAAGQVLVNKSTTGSVTVIETNLMPGVYFVKVTLAGKNTTKKVIIN